MNAESIAKVYRVALREYHLSRRDFAAETPDMETTTAWVEWYLNHPEATLSELINHAPDDSVTRALLLDGIAKALKDI